MPPQVRGSRGAREVAAPDGHLRRDGGEILGHGSLGHWFYLHVKIINARLRRRIQHGSDGYSPVVGVVEGLRGDSPPRRPAYPLAGSWGLRFCRAGGAAAQRAGSGKRERGTGTSDQRIDHGGDRPSGAEVAGGALHGSIGPAGAGGPSDGGGPEADRVRVPRSCGGDGGGDRRADRGGAGRGRGPAEEVGVECRGAVRLETPDRICETVYLIGARFLALATSVITMVSESHDPFLRQNPSEPRAPRCLSGAGRCHSAPVP